MPTLASEIKALVSSLKFRSYHINAKGDNLGYNSKTEISWKKYYEGEAQAYNEIALEISRILVQYGESND